MIANIESDDGDSVGGIAIDRSRLSAGGSEVYDAAVFEHGHHVGLYMLLTGVPSLETDADLERFHDRVFALSLWEDATEAWRTIRLLRGLRVACRRVTDASFCELLVRTKFLSTQAVRRVEGADSDQRA